MLIGGCRSGGFLKIWLMQWVSFMGAAAPDGGIVQGDKVEHSGNRDSRLPEVAASWPWTDRDLTPVLHCRLGVDGH